MKRAFTIVVINIILVLIQVSFFPALSNNLFIPNLILALSLTLFFLDKTSAAFISAFSGGLLLDLLATSVVGVSLIYIVGLVTGLSYTKRFLYKNTFVKMVLVFLSALLYLVVVTSLNASFPRMLVASSLATLVFYQLFTLVIKKLTYDVNLDDRS